MTMTSGRRPAASIEASSSSACAPPAASPTTLMSGSLSRNASRPRRTSSWSSTTSTPMLSSTSGSISASVRFGGHIHSHERAEARRARDREATADLGRAAAHRLESEVTGMADGGIEAAPVVADFDRDYARHDLDKHARGGRARVLLDVGERLAPDREQLRLDELRQLEPRTGPAHVHVEPIRRAHSGGLSRERGDQPVVHGVAAQLEDER